MLTETMRPTERNRWTSGEGRITISAAVTAHPTWSRSRAKPIAAQTGPGQSQADAVVQHRGVDGWPVRSDRRRTGDWGLRPEQ